MGKIYRKVIFYGIRLACYAALLVSLYFIYMYDAKHATGEVKITDTSATELFQEIFVVITAAGFFITGRWAKHLAPVTDLASLVFVMSAIREMNNLIPSWFYFVAPFILLFLYLLVKNFKKVVVALADFVELRSTGAFFLGFLVTYVFSRFFGKAKLWEAMLGDAYTRNAKNLGEEGIELLGYALILISVVELLVYAYQKKHEPLEKQ
jgi:hypothetical protein